jgi:biopolymer transport protein TolR
MAISAQSDSDDVMSEINVTPLVDVMLVLMVVFLVTAPLLTNGVRVNLPKTAATAPPEEHKALSLSIDARGKVYLDHSEVALARLEQQLRGLKAGQSSAGHELAIHLNADQAVNYGVVAKVMASVDRAGINQLSVLTVAE